MYRLCTELKKMQFRQLVFSRKKWRKTEHKKRRFTFSGVPPLFVLCVLFVLVKNIRQSFGGSFVSRFYRMGVYIAGC